MAQLQHWSVTCTTCDSPAEYHCNTCGDILCPRCREIHQRSRGTGHHSVVPYSDRVEPGKLSEQCDDHPGHTCTLWCQTCDKAACTECVTSPDHNGHGFVKMAAKLEEQRNAMRAEFDSYSKLLKHWEDSLQQIQVLIKTYQTDLDGLGKEISQAADRVCNQMAQLQHWSVTCTTCDSPAEYHCNTCGDILCQRCREIHQRSRASSHHSVVPYSERIEPGKLSEQCDNHPGLPCMLWCQKCDKATCTECVTSVDHKGHDFIKMTTKLEEQRNAMREEFGIYTNLLKQWEDSFHLLEIKIKTFETDCDKLREEITQTADKTCNQVRNIEAALQRQLQQIKSTQASVFHDHEKILHNGVARIKQLIKEAENNLRSDDVGVLLHYKFNEHKGLEEKPPNPPSPSLPVFSPGEIEVQRLEAMLGCLTVKTKEVNENEIEGDQTVQPSTVASASKQPSHESSDLRSRKKQLLPIAMVITTIQTSKYYLPYLVCTRSGPVWMRITQDKVQLIDRQRTVKNTVNTSFPYIGGLTTTTEGEILCSNYSEKSINAVSENGGVRTLFTTTPAPHGICSLRNGNLVVTFPDESSVVQYKRTGKVVKELNKSLFTYPRSVAQNRVNKHLYVCDRSGIDIESPGRLLAFDMVSGDLKYEYTGSDANTFTPSDVCTDKAGHVIVTDWYNDKIHILDKDCSFLQYMLTKEYGLHRPFCIDTDADGYAWVSEYYFTETISRVKLIKYTI